MQGIFREKTSLTITTIWVFPPTGGLVDKICLTFSVSSKKSSRHSLHPLPLAQSRKLKSADWSRRRQRKSTDTVALEQVGKKLGKGPPRETTKKQRLKN